MRPIKVALVLAFMALLLVSTRVSMATQIELMTHQDARMGYAACNAMDYMHASPQATAEWLHDQYKVPEKEARQIVFIAIQTHCK